MLRSGLTAFLKNGNYIRHFPKIIPHSWNLNSSFTLTTRWYKTFLNKENTYAHGILENGLQYKGTLVSVNPVSETLTEPEFETLLAQNWREKNKNEVVAAFIKISDYALKYKLNISDSMFDNLTEGVLVNCTQFTFDDLLSVLKALIKWPETENLNSPNYGDLWSALDDMCMRASDRKNVATEDLLLLIDCWYYLDLARKSDFVYRALLKISKRVDYMPPAQFVQTMFYVNIRRRSLEKMYDFEHRFVKIFDQLTIDEIGIVCMAFFKTKTVFHCTATSSKIIDRLISEIDSIKDISLTAILKMLRFSKSMIPEKLSQLLNVLSSKVDQFSLLSCVHIALLGSNIQIFNPLLIQKVCEKIVKNVKTTRLKDVERIAFVTASFNFKPKLPNDQDMYELFIEELKSRDTEIIMYPKSLSYFLSYLALQKYLPDELISKALDIDFVKENYGMFKRHHGRDILTLDCSIEIEKPDYKGNRLPPKWRYTLPKYLTDYPPRQDNKEFAMKIMWQLMQYVAQLQGGPQFIFTEHILPHFARADIIFCNDLQGNPINVETAFSGYNLGDVKYPPVRNNLQWKPTLKPTEEKCENLGDPVENNLRWHAVVIGGKNMYIRNINEPQGALNMKLRQLKCIGYNPILIPYYEWDFELSHEEKIRYLQSKLDKHSSNSVNPSIIKNKITATS